MAPHPCRFGPDLPPPPPAHRGRRTERPPLPRSRPLQSVLSAFLLLAVTLPARAEVIYDNFANTLVSFVSRPEEFGDEIRFAGSARVITAMTFEIVGERDLPAEARAIFRIYRNNGPIPAPPDPAIPTPGELLYESDEIPLSPGIQTLRITDIEIAVPNVVIWTVEFHNTPQLAGERAGLQVYFPPAIGRTFRDYWVRDPDSFRLYLLGDGLPAAFGARFEAQPDPPILVHAALNPDGRPLLTVTGPIGSEHIVEASTDSRNWRALGVVSLATTNATTFLADRAPPGGEQFYRTRPSPFPGRTVLVKSIQRSEAGASLLTLEGPIGSETVIESSPNGQQWRPLDIVRFPQAVITYEDATPRAGQHRFYRTRRPEHFGALYLIRSVVPQPDGTVVLTALGRPSIQTVTVEATSDYQTWTTVGTIRFNTEETTFVDSDPAASGRIYRLRI